MWTLLTRKFSLADRQAMTRRLCAPVDDPCASREQFYEQMRERFKFYLPGRESMAWNTPDPSGEFIWIDLLVYALAVYPIHAEEAYAVWNDGVIAGVVDFFTNSAGEPCVSLGFIDRGVAHAAASRLLSGRGRVVAYCDVRNKPAYRACKRLFTSPPVMVFRHATPEWRFEGTF